MRKSILNSCLGASMMELMVGMSLMGTVIAASTAVSKIAASQTAALIGRDSLDQLTDLMRSRLQFADTCTESFGNGRLNISPLVSNDPGDPDEVSMMIPRIDDPTQLTAVGQNVNLPELGLRVRSLRLQNPVPVSTFTRPDGTVIEESIAHLYVGADRMGIENGDSTGASGVGGGSYREKYIGSVILSANQATGDIVTCHGTIGESFENVCEQWGCNFVEGANPECQCDYNTRFSCPNDKHVPIGIDADGKIVCANFGGDCETEGTYVSKAGPDYVECRPPPVTSQWDIGPWGNCPVNEPTPTPEARIMAQATVSGGCGSCTNGPLLDTTMSKGQELETQPAYCACGSGMGGAGAYMCTVIVQYEGDSQRYDGTTGGTLNVQGETFRITVEAQGLGANSGASCHVEWQ